MKIFEILVIAIGLSMDAFAVSVCKGMSIKKIAISHCIIVGVWFGLFQGIMPVFGYYMGGICKGGIIKYGDFISFILLTFIGIDMIKDSFSQERKNESNNSLGFNSMLILAVATSIDAMAVGVTFNFYKINMPLACVLIGTITFVMSMMGVVAGHLFGSRIMNKAQVCGGIILILIGVKMLL